MLVSQVGLVWEVNVHVRLPGLVECITLATVATRRLISEPTEEMPQTRPNNKITRKEQMKYVILSHKPT